MSSANLSRAIVAFVCVAVLLGGIALGMALPSLADQPIATPSATATAVPPTDAALPVTDVKGEDLRRLPRYEGSVRSQFSVTTDRRYRLTAVEYLSDASLNEVRTFYQSVISEHGWQRADIDYSAGEWTYVLVDGPTEALIEIELSGGLVEIDLQISEPIARPSPTPRPTPTPAPTATPQPAPPAPAPPAPAPPPPGDDDDDGDDGDDGGDEDGDD